MKSISLFAILYLPITSLAQKSFLDTLKVTDTVRFETTVSADFTYIRKIPDKDVTGIEVHKGDSVKLAFLTEGQDYGLYLFWKLSTGGYIKDEALVQTPAMLAYKKKAMVLINKRIDEQFKVLDAIKSKQDSILAKEVSILDKIFGKQNGMLIYHNMLWIGMTDNMAEYSIGKPDRVNRSTYSWGIEEQWVYDRRVYTYGAPLYLYFNNSKLTAYQESR